LQTIAAVSEVFSQGVGGHPGTLTLYGSSGQALDTLTFAGALNTDSFKLFALNSGGTEIAFGQ
jgi:hypothetical protein